jgi:hypothetical protein
MQVRSPAGMLNDLIYDLETSTQSVTSPHRTQSWKGVRPPRRMYGTSSSTSK